MELKRACQSPETIFQGLLIVPYGIETVELQTECARNELLIVPYGIETFLRIPYHFRAFLLLIVPYGIETTSVQDSIQLLPSFNRTLWN